MTYRLFKAGVGLAEERLPIPENGKVKFTFCGESADYVCICGRFYPIADGAAEVPTEDLPEAIAVSAYSIAERKRYLCDSLIRVGGESGKGTAFLVPAPSEDRELISLLAERIATLEERLSEAEKRISRHEKSISGNIFTFGGYHES